MEDLADIFYLIVNCFIQVLLARLRGDFKSLHLGVISLATTKLGVFFFRIIRKIEIRVNRCVCL